MVLTFFEKLGFKIRNMKNSFIVVSVIYFINTLKEDISYLEPLREITEKI